MSNLPSIILISPPTKKSGETELLNKFFDAGLMRFHLRKPNVSTEELKQYLGQVSEEHHSKIVVHRCPELVKEFSLAGYHHRSSEPTCLTNGTSSRSLHTLNELCSLDDGLDYVFFGPVYESISKGGYKPKFSLSEIFSFFRSGTLQNFEKQTKVYALGGIRKKKMKRLAEVGFSGVALLGSVWGSRDPLKSLNDFLNFDIDFLLSSRIKAS